MSTIRSRSLWTSLVRALGLSALCALAILSSPDVEACGGSRSGICTWLVGPASSPVSSTIHGSTWADVRTLAPNEMRADWVSGKLLGELPGFGPFVMGYQEGRPSYVEIVSNQPGGVPFFPATAKQTLYYYLDLLDKDGNVTRTLINQEPMVMVSQISAIPPFGSVFETRQPVEFFDAAGGAKPVVVLEEGATGWITNSGGFDVKLVDFSVDETTGQFSTVWEVGASAAAALEKPSKAALPARWFATGLYGVEFDGALDATKHASAHGLKEAAGDLSLGDKQRITLSGTLDLSDARAGVAMHAISTDGQKLEGHSVFSFFKGVDGYQLAKR
jgi:hypothetical protein